MFILKLICSNKERSSDEFKKFNNLLKNKNIVVESDKDDKNNINISCDTCDNEVTEMIFLNISNYIYETIINNYNKKQITEFLTDNYFFLKESEIAEVKEIIMSVLKKEKVPEDDIDIECFADINYILNKIKQDIRENKEINVKGFITFRAKRFFDDIESIINKVAERYMVDNEYIEFIKLMKYFVDIQECKTEKIIITVNNNDYSVKDSDDNDLYNSFLQAVDSPINGDIKMEDLIMSGLITSAPKYIEIYNKKNCKSKDFLDVIEKVFGNKIIYIND